jgi:hypothetical protein
MEVAYVTLQGMNLELVGILEDRDRIRQKEIFGLTPLDVEKAGCLDTDAILITSLHAVGERIRNLERYVDLSKVKLLSG